MKRILAVFLIFGSSLAYSAQGDLDLTILGVSDHMKNKTYGYPAQQKNDLNWGGGISYEVFDNVDLGIGTYYNSIRQQSQYVNISYHFLKFEWFSFVITEQATNGFGRTVTTYSRGRPTGSYNTNPNNYSTKIGVCLDTHLSENHSPQVCIKTPIASSSGTEFDQLNLYIKIPLTNLLN